MWHLHLLCLLVTKSSLCLCPSILCLINPISHSFSPSRGDWLIAFVSVPRVRSPFLLFLYPVPYLETMNRGEAWQGSWCSESMMSSGGQLSWQPVPPRGSSQILGPQKGTWAQELSPQEGATLGCPHSRPERTSRWHFSCGCISQWDKDICLGHWNMTFRDCKCNRWESRKIAEQDSQGEPFLWGDWVPLFQSISRMLCLGHDFKEQSDYYLKQRRTEIPRRVCTFAYHQSVLQPW
jgi:hypothetical protein